MREIIKGPTLIQRQLEVAMRDAPNVVSLPKPEITHETPQITAAIDAITEFGEQLNPTAPMTDKDREAHKRIVAEIRAEEQAENQPTAVEPESKPTKQDAIVTLPETSRQRYRRALEVQQAVKSGTASTADARWLGGYEQTAEFKVENDFHEDFGETYLTPER